MEANELRIGNWVNCSIYNGNTDVDIQFEFQEYKYIHLFKPIPLTEERLLKFGFEKKIVAKYSFYQLNVGCLRFNFSDNKLHFGIQGVSNVEWVEYTLKYVHQLQNLYFTLTGEELHVDI